MRADSKPWTHPHTHRCSVKRTRAQTDKRTHPHADRQARAHTHTHTQANTHTHARTHTHTHTQNRTHAPDMVCWPLWLSGRSSFAQRPALHFTFCALQSDDWVVYTSPPYLFTYTHSLTLALLFWLVWERAISVAGYLPLLIIPVCIFMRPR
jgi:hypothetical protein